MADEITPQPAPQTTSRRRRNTRPGIERREPFAGMGMMIFGAIALLAPLAFGAVDQSVQALLTALLGIGLIVVRPRIELPTGGARWLLVGFVALLLGKEFLPAIFFHRLPPQDQMGQIITATNDWRAIVERTYRIALPWTHSPEPGRALDFLLAGLVAVLWFNWARTLAVEKSRRHTMLWTLVAAAAVVALVSFFTRSAAGGEILGYRSTPGWFGFGTFPNRNNTAAYFAMGILLLIGGMGWALAKKRHLIFLLGIILLAVLLPALFETESRGGTLAAGLGVFVFCGFLAAHWRDRRAVIVISLVLAVGAVVFLVGGKEVLERFTSETRGAGSNAMRVQIWKDSLTMLRDAPLFGQGAGMFQRVYPFFQTVFADDNIIMHPESSWLQWLIEFGVIAVGIAVVFGVKFIAPKVRSVFEQRSDFFISAGAFSAAALLLGHSFIDTSGVRWGTAWTGLAALALACPAAPTANRRHGLGILALAVSAFWAMPCWIGFPAWQPRSIENLLISETRSGAATLDRLASAVRCQPLEPAVHQAYGHRLAFQKRGAGGEWRDHFRFSARLMPASWSICARLAADTRDFDPMLAIHFWQQAVDRSRAKAGNVLYMAVGDTRTIPQSRSIWRGYVEAHPELILSYCLAAPDEPTRKLVELWWETRGSVPGIIHTDIEHQHFNQLASAWMTDAQLDAWVKKNITHLSIHGPRWAQIFHEHQNHERAWFVLSKLNPLPSYGPEPPTTDIESARRLYETSGKTLVRGRNLGHALEAAGQSREASDLFIELAKAPKASLWFRRKAAWCHAERDEYKEAVALLL